MSHISKVNLVSESFTIDPHFILRTFTKNSFFSDDSEKLSDLSDDISVNDKGGKFKTQNVGIHLTVVTQSLSR
jgi:hypothetical protein